MAERNCAFQPNQEYMYKLEIQVDCLDLKYQQNNEASCPICIFVEFLDLPRIAITQKDCSTNNELNTFEFEISKPCFFLKSLCDLAKTIRSKLIKIEVYHFSSLTKCQCICYAEASFTEYECSEIDTFSIQSTESSKPFIMKKAYQLLNQQNNNVGCIMMSFKLCCFGEDKEYEGLSDENNLECICPSLQLPQPAPRLSFGEPGFEKLTSAEKLNDPNYRKLIYQMYSNEPTCECPVRQHCVPASLKQANICKSGCMNSCCFKLKQHEDYLQCKNKMNNDIPCNVPKYNQNSETIFCDNNQDCFPRFPANHIKNGDNFDGKIGDYNDNTRKNFNDIMTMISELKSCACSEKKGFQDLSKPVNDKNKNCTNDLNDGIDRLLRTMKDMYDIMDSLGKPNFGKTKELFTSPRDTEFIDADCMENELETNVNNIGPCGNSRCKSRRKKLPNDAKHTNSISEENTSNNQENTKLNIQFADNNKKYIANNKYYLGSKSNRNASSKSTHSNVSRKIARFVYSAGDIYPGWGRAHKDCVEARRRIPANMGWLWNLNESIGKLKYRNDWKPGAMNIMVKDIIRKNKDKFLKKSKERPNSAPSSERKHKAPRRRSLSMIKRTPRTTKEEVSEEDVEPPPTLRLLRKNGNYYVTMYPIKQDTMKIPQLEIPTKPLQFKIAKSKDGASLASSSTASNMEIEFSPPPAVSRYRKKPDVIHVDTQVKQQEILNAFKLEIGEKKMDKKLKKKEKKRN